MTAVVFIVIASFCCGLPYVNSYVHYGVNLDADNEIEGSSDSPVKEELVQITHSFANRDEDSDLNLKLHAFGQDLAVNLTRVGSVLVGTSTPIWLAHGSEEGNVTFTRAGEKALRDAVKLYQDQKSESSILVIPGINPLFLGTILGFHIRYQPMVVRISGRIHRRSIDDDFGSNAHLVSKISRRTREAEQNVASAVQSQIQQSSADSNASVIYPQLLVTTDYNIPFESVSSREFYDHLIYILAFFNGLDLIFHQLSNPEVRLHIAGIVVAADRSAVPYIHKNKNSTGAVDATKALAEMGRFYEALHDKDFPAGSYDIITTLTNTYICNDHEAEICSPALAGVSSVEPLCKDNYPVVSMAAIFGDNLGFSGLRMAAHQLGHIIGAEHDGEEAEGTQDCSAQDGHLMSKYNDSSVVSLHWSRCSLEGFKKMLQSSSAECLRNPPKWNQDDAPLPAILPGEVLGLDCQCRRFGYHRACAGPQNCQALTCTHDLFPFFNFDCVKVGTPAAQGSVCSIGHHCINGECVKKDI